MDTWLRCAVGLELATDSGLSKQRFDAISDRTDITESERNTELLKRVFRAPAAQTIGSGVLVESKGLLALVTAAHVVAELSDPNALTRLLVGRRADLDLPIGGISLASPLSAMTQIAVAGVNQDVAVVRIWPAVQHALNDAGFVGLPLSAISSAVPAVGLAVTAVHFPGADRAEGPLNPRGPRPDEPGRVTDRETDRMLIPQISVGQITRAPATVAGVTFHAAASIKVGPGSSGAPVFDSDSGELVGLVAATDPASIGDDRRHTVALLSSPAHFLPLL